MSDSVQPHRQQPTRLTCPWDSPGKNTGVGCHFLLQCMKVKSESEVAQSCPTLSDPVDCSLPGSSIHGIFQQEYWSGVPLPSPSLYICVHINIYKFCMFIYIYLYNGILLNHKKKTEILPFVATWMNLGAMTLREISQKKTNTM